MMKRDSGRNRKIDFIRGISIILMVLGHAHAPGSKFAALFNMPVFFMISGYLFDPASIKTINDLLRFYLRKIKSLWWTYFSWNTIFVLLNNVFLKLHIYSDNVELENTYGIYNSLNHHMSLKEMLIAIMKGFFMLGGGTRMGGAFWFLMVLFGVSVAYATIQYFLNRSKFCSAHFMKIQALAALLLLGAGYGLGAADIMLYGISPCFSVYVLFHMGNCFRFIEEKHERKNSVILHVAIGAVAGGCLLCMNHIGSVNLGNNRYENPLFLLVSSAAGWMMLYEIACFLSETKFGGMIETAGENSLPIMIFHFLAFKLVSLAGVMTENKPLFLIAAFPILYEGGLWWAFYCLAGVGLPVLLCCVKKHAQGRWKLFK